MKIKIIILLLSIITVTCNNYVKHYDLRNDLVKSFGFLSDSIYRYQIESINSDMISFQESINIESILHLCEDNDYNVKLLSSAIQRIFKNNTDIEFFKDNVWTVANIHRLYMYVEPYRAGYDELIGSHKGSKKSYFEYLVDMRVLNLDIINSHSAVNESISVYGPYVEDETKEELITIYYPLYFNKKLESILLIDLKSGFIDEYISDFNLNNLTSLEIEGSISIDKVISNLVTKNPNATTPIFIDYKLFLFSVIVVFFVFSYCYRLISHFLSLFNEHKKDKLTGFYRKDYVNLFDEVNCIIVIDIDRFKNVNDTYGHAIGDVVISEVCHRIKGTIRETDVAIRWGGEEFVILLRNEISERDLIVKLNTMLSSINSMKINNIDVTVSIGCYLSLNKVVLIEAFKYADSALYESKQTGRNKYTISLNN